MVATRHSSRQCTTAAAVESTRGSLSQRRNAAAPSNASTPATHGQASVVKVAAWDAGLVWPACLATAVTL